VSHARARRTPTRRGRLLRAGLAGLAAGACATAIAACGSSADHPSATATSTRYGRALEFVKCMRTHGLSNFPDPRPGGGIQIPTGSGIDPFSPAFKTARSACARFLPGPLPGSQHPTAAEIAAARQTSECMRQHGVSEFPDPTLKPPPNPAAYSILQDRGGVILAVPSTIDPQSPAFVRAATACNFR
jgi:hypothetical protein